MAFLYLALLSTLAATATASNVTCSGQAFHESMEESVLFEPGSIIKVVCGAGEDRSLCQLDGTWAPPAKTHCAPVEPEVGQCYTCSDYAAAGESTDGVFPIYLWDSEANEHVSAEAYCKFQEPAQTLFLRRVSGAGVDFRVQNWAAYEAGFGDVNENYFIGLRNLHLLTGSCGLTESKWRVDCPGGPNAFNGSGTYSGFTVKDASTQYAVDWTSFNSDSGSMADSLGSNSKVGDMAFGTADRNVPGFTYPCPGTYGPMWLESTNCNNAMPFGTYRHNGECVVATARSPAYQGMYWGNPTGLRYDLKELEAGVTKP